MSYPSKKNIDHSGECFEQLEEWVADPVYVQELLEDEVTQLLGGRKNERRREVDAPGAHRNGYGKERRLGLSYKGGTRLDSAQLIIWFQASTCTTSGTGYR